MPEHDFINAAIAAVDAAIQPWRQGDCTVGDHGFVYRQLPDVDGIDVAEEGVEGLIVVSQTCDVIRSSADRPLVDVCPIVEVSDETFQGVLKRRTPRYALIPALAGQKLVADLDRTMSVQKSVLATWTRTAGWVSSYQLAALTGKKQSEIFWDINEMLDELPHPELEDGISFVNIATKRAEVKLNKLMTYRLIMRYTRSHQDVIRCAWGDIEIPVDPSLQAKLAVDKKHAPHPRQRRAQKAPL